MKNKLIISLKDNPELQEYFAKKGVGRECTLEVTASVDDMTPDQATLSVSEVEAYEESEPEVASEPASKDGDYSDKTETASSMMSAFKK
jgi:hypothetical protein